MTITLTLGTWIVPLIFTLLSVICFVLVNIFEEDTWGIRPFMAFVAGVSATIVSWLVWLIITLMTK